METELAFISDEADAFLAGESIHEQTDEGAIAFAEQTAMRIESALLMVIRERWNTAAWERGFDPIPECSICGERISVDELRDDSGVCGACQGTPS